jgi:hypothetical protein
MFEDRDVILKEEAPGGAWNLYIYGQSKADPSRLPPDEPKFYASFRKKAKDTITCLPFGHDAAEGDVKVKWDAAPGVCEVYLGEECYLMFWYGTWKGRRRGYFRVSPDPAFSREEIELMEKQGYLPL